jgi:spore germination cell wall hydrolase CwlJ-like protein
MNQRAKSLHGLLTFYKRKETNRYSVAFEAMKSKLKQKEYLLNQLVSIVQKINKNKLATPFNKLQLANIRSNPTEATPQVDRKAPIKPPTKSEIFQAPAADNQALIDKLDKLKKAISSANSELASF